MRLLILSLVVLFMVPSAVLAQVPAKDPGEAKAPFKTGSFVIFGAASIPMGDFADDKTEKDGWASPGFGIGFEYIRHFPSQPGLGWITTIAGVYNPSDLSKDEVEALAEELSGEDLTVTSYDAGGWVNVPILTGVRYAGDMSPTTQIYGLGQVGFNYSTGPTIEATGEDFAGDPVSGEVTIGSATSLAIALGAGIIFNDKFNLSLRYMSLGEAKQDVEFTGAGESGTAGEKETKITMVLITVGYSW